MTLERIKELSKQLDTYPVEEIRECLKMISFYGFPVAEYLDDCTIERGVENTVREPVFSEIKRISINPNPSKKYGRASTPYNSIFYGLIYKKNTPEKFKILNRIGCSCEIVDLLRNNKQGKALVTFSKWKVVQQLNVVAIIDPFKKYEDKTLNNLQQFMTKNFNITLDQKKIMEFFAKEFSTEILPYKNHEYLISSLYTEFLIQTLGYDGVLYPSVQSKKFGLDFLCIALSKEAVNKLKPQKILQCGINKTESDITYNNLMSCEIKDVS